MSIPCHHSTPNISIISTMILKTFGPNVSSAIIHLHTSRSVKLVFIFSATSLQSWTTEEECLVMAHSCCTRYVNLTVSTYDILKVLKVTTPYFFTTTGPTEENHCYHCTRVRRRHRMERYPRACCG